MKKKEKKPVSRKVIENLQTTLASSGTPAIAKKQKPNDSIEEVSQAGK